MTRAIGRPLAVLALAAVLGLAGCTSESPVPAPSASTDQPAPEVQSPSAAASSSAGPAAPALVPDGSAEDNLPFFSQVVAGVWSGPDQVSGRAYVDALAAAGFDKTAMQVTADYSTIGNAAESIEFSVRLEEDCLVGQVGPSIGDPVTTVLPGLSSGGCLIGQTRPIDW
ncbi:DUF6993 domain-containing protein [Microbacterium sp. NPDC090007]|uniref:DUF6993 domain-containing protein n=1 Tax=Microbacterium sp. NPDC090007 TaxID=3364204 RepID=UPI0037FB08AC